MKLYYQILILVLISFSCSNPTTEYNNLVTPDLSEIVYSEIEFLDMEHKVLFLNSDNKTDDIKNLKNELRELIKFDIDSTTLNQFRQSKQDCDGVRQKIWSNDSFTLTYSNFEKKSQKNQIELIRVNIDSENDKIELLTVSGRPLEYLIINNKKYNPTYESRIVGLDEVIKELKEKNCR